ncbi:MAG: sulfur carrier protein ThiS [Gemmatimonadota bacterium]|nr:sulfur carrier protein ThiS [Gemmatimonadota bacterium]
MSENETIRVQVNGKEREIDRGHTVRSLLESLDVHPGMVVVELNRDILERDRYAAVAVSEGDALELVHFVGGG